MSESQQLDVGKMGRHMDVTDISSEEQSAGIVQMAETTGRFAWGSI